MQNLKINDNKVSYTQPGIKEVKKSSDQEKWKEYKRENQEEVLVLSFNQTKPAETYKQIFKIGLENNPKFPKTLDDVPLLSVPFVVGQETFYEEKSCFGGQLGKFLKNYIKSYQKRMLEYVATSMLQRRP